MSEPFITSLSPRVVRYGLEEPLEERHHLRAGPVTALIEGSNLRYIRVSEHEIVRGIYMAVRDQNWGTPPPRFLTYDVQQNEDGFVVKFRAEHIEHEVNFVWDGTISGTSDGVVTYVMDGEVRNTFMRGRIGICLLHPMSLAGVPVEVLSDGEWIKGEFPVQISAHQPFFDIQAMRYEVGPGIEVDTRFEGDLFEMEDQRNWTDASYKTYSTPLRIPYPVEVKTGERVKQTITITARNGDTGDVLPAAKPAVTVSTHEVATLPEIGLGTASHGRPLSAVQVEKLKALSLGHLLHEALLLEPDWEEQLRQAGQDARALGISLDLAAVTDDQGSNLERFVAVLAANDLPISQLTVFARYTTSRNVAAKLRELMAAANLRLPLGGGSRAYFTEFNRAHLPLDLLDFAAWAISPQVHAFDNASLMETLAAQTITVESGRAIAGSLPLAVGPLTLKPRINPNATGPAPELAPGELPVEVDPRQMALFGAAWMVGSLRYLATAGADRLTYFETTGARGVVDDERAERHPLFHAPVGSAFPMYHVFADVGEFSGARLMAVQTSDPLTVDLLALRLGNRLRVLVANLTNERQSVDVALPLLQEAELRLLDETTAVQAMMEPSAFRGRVDARFGPRLEQLALDLAPYAVARLDATVAD